MHFDSNFYNRFNNEFLEQEWNKKTKNGRKRFYQDNFIIIRRKIWLLIINTRILLSYIVKTNCESEIFIQNN